MKPASYLRSVSLLLALLPVALCAACSDSSDAPAANPVDAAIESSTDAATDALTEEASTGKEAGPDALVPDAGPDGQDAAADTSGEDQVVPDGNADAQEAAAAQLGVVSVPELVIELQNKDFLLINVHVPYAGEIPQTDADMTYLDVPAIEAFVGSKLDTKVVLYCMSNYMSGIAGNAMVLDGYSNVRYLDGGLGAWQSAGQPVEYHDQ